MAVLAVLGSLACRMTLSPLQNRIAVGHESFVVFAAVGEDDLGDLFAVSTNGGPIYPVTYTRLHESVPALSPSGGMLAFFRARSATDSTDVRLVVMNLLNGAERVLVEAGPGLRLQAVTWHPAETHVYVRTSAGILEAAVPPAAPRVAPVTDSAAADSAFRVILGDPAFAEVAPCRTGAGLCTRPREGEEVPLPEDITGPLRWGEDSLAYFAGTDLVIRPLAGGRARTLRWSDPPARPRDATVSLVPIGQ
jgi:hypothetical protein